MNDLLLYFLLVCLLAVVVYQEIAYAPAMRRMREEETEREGEEGGGRLWVG